MAVEYIKYKGEELPVQVGYYALKHMQKHTKGKGMAHLQEDFALYEPLLYFSLKMGHLTEDKPFTFKMADMELILEDVLFSQFIHIVGNSFTDEAEATEEEGDAKKK